ncbi:Type-1A pilin [Leminorella grimontii]|nr:Type-1A pilin [Leminorella grimontii]
MKMTARRTYTGPLCRLLSGALALVALQAQAVNCEFTSLFTENLTIPVIGPGLSTVGEDAPIGKVIYSAQFMGTSRNTSYECTITVEDLEAGQGQQLMNVYNKIETIATPSGAPTQSGDKSVYPTNVPGVGAVFYMTGSVFNNAQYPAIWEREFQIGYGTTTQGLGQVSIVKIELIKTGPIPAGTQLVLGSSFPTFQISSGSKSPIATDRVFVTVNFSGAITAHTKTCQLATPVIDVSLGLHQRASFTGVGSATEWKGFEITLKDCPPFYGYGQYRYTESSGLTTGTSSANRVALAFNSAHGVVENNPLLAKLESGPNSAEGIGIEVSEGGVDNPINLDGTGGFDLQNLLTDDGATYVIPLKARYVQYDTNVKAGIANGAVVFTITYQ